MSLILLADHSPHSRRMGERILSEEGYQVICLEDSKLAFEKLNELDPDILMIDTGLPGLKSLELCRYAKSRSSGTRVILTVGALETIDDAAARAAGCDAILRKPFESSVVISTVQLLIQQAQIARQSRKGLNGVGTQDVQALVSEAVRNEMPRFVEEITAKVMMALSEIKN